MIRILFFSSCKLKRLYSLFIAKFGPLVHKLNEKHLQLCAFYEIEQKSQESPKKTNQVALFGTRKIVAEIII